MQQPHLVLFELRQPPPDHLQVGSARVVDEPRAVAALACIDDFEAVIVHKIAVVWSHIFDGQLTRSHGVRSRGGGPNGLGGAVFVVGQDAAVTLVPRDDLRRGEGQSSVMQQDKSERARRRAPYLAAVLEDKFALLYRPHGLESESPIPGLFPHSHTSVISKKNV